MNIDPEAFFTVFTIVSIATFSALLTVRFIIRSHRREVKEEIEKGFQDIQNRIAQS